MALHDDDPLREEHSGKTGTPEIIEGLQSAVVVGLELQRVVYPRADALGASYGGLPGPTATQEIEPYKNAF